jgi:hypothetical protein
MEFAFANSNCCACAQPGHLTPDLWPLSAEGQWPFEVGVGIGIGIVDVAFAKSNCAAVAALEWNDCWSCLSFVALAKKEAGSLGGEGKLRNTARSVAARWMGQVH